MPIFCVSTVKVNWKHCGKGEIACNEQFLLFPHIVFYWFEELSAIFIKSEIVVCKLFEFENV